MNYKVSKIKRLELETYLNVQELINLKSKKLKKNSKGYIENLL